MTKGKTRIIKPKIFKCNCLKNPRLNCKNKLKVYKFGGGDFQIAGVYFFPKDLKKFIKYLKP